jgi:phosphoribosylamine--glycine ligase
MRVLVVGSGGREHALAWALARSPHVTHLLIAPGNAGTAELGENVPIPANDIAGLTALARERRVDLVVVGPEEPLARGLADQLRAAGIPTLGPDAAGARIESSKAWAKEVMAAAGVPTARAQRFTQLADALAALADWPTPVVVKASGLAAGKGVIVAGSRAEAEQALRWMLEAGGLGEAGREVLLEEYLEGREVSCFALTDGETVVPLLPACDYKRVGDNDTGPNTGGMGAYSPVPWLDAPQQQVVLERIMRPTLAELARRGIRYRGILYAGLMMTADGPKVLEFNCRLGDPEAQAVLPLLASDAAMLFAAAALGELAHQPLPQWHDGAAVTVVLASGGYPGPYETGKPISGLADLPEGVLAFHAGTRRDPDGTLRTAGGRVLALTARGHTIAEARARVYAAVARVQFPGMHYRRDIAARELH